MYIPNSFEVTDIHQLHDFIEAYPFVTLISQKNLGFDVSHVPILLDRGKGQKGELSWHVARGNPHAIAFDTPREALLIFHGPHAYISHTWYKTSPSVPTWNYAVVHVYGIPEKVSSETLSEDLSKMMAFFEGDPSKNSVIPSSYKANLMESIVGFHMEISRIEGKFKLGQNRSTEDQQGMIKGLRETNTSEALDLATFIQSKLR